MNNFVDWKAVLATEGLRVAATAYAREESPEYLEPGPDGNPVISEDDYPYVLTQAIKAKGRCAFYFIHGGDNQVQDHIHYLYGGKYFEYDGHGQIGGPYDENDADTILGLVNDQVMDEGLGSLPAGSIVEVGGDLPDEYFIARCAGLVALGQQIKINGAVFFRTQVGLVPKD